MKRANVILIILIALFVFMGCQATNQYLQTDIGALIVKKAGKIAGIAVGFEKPQDIKKIEKYCNYLLEEKDEGLKKAALESAYKFIYKRYGKNVKTALLMSEATDIIGLVIKDETLSFTENYNLEAMDMFVKAFRDGLLLTKF